MERADSIALDLHKWMTQILHHIVLFHSHRAKNFLHGITLPSVAHKLACIHTMATALIAGDRGI
jgi:hypothetical protein